MQGSSRDLSDADWRDQLWACVRATCWLTTIAVDGKWLRGILDAQVESVHGLRDTAYVEGVNTACAGNEPEVMATFRNLDISLLRLVGDTEITRTSRSSHATEPAYSITYRYDTQSSVDFGDPVFVGTPNPGSLLR